MVIIIITSAVCISNSFAISINQKTKQYGMLASIGATPRQIRKNVFFEAAFMGVIGVAAGIVGGLSASYILVILSNKMLIDTLEMNGWIGEPQGAQKQREIKISREEFEAMKDQTRF